MAHELQLTLYELELETYEPAEHEVHFAWCVTLEPDISILDCPEGHEL